MKKEKIFFRSDYSLGAHPRVMEALVRTNNENTDGYGIDPHCENAARLIKKLIGREDASVHMMVGGTSCNITVIAAALRPYQSVISVRTGHIYSHETGGVDATGHRVQTVEGTDGKMTPEMIDKAFLEFQDEHTIMPGMAYISQPTELGTIYSKNELTALSEKCKERGIYLYIDGARLGAALTSPDNDLTIAEMASLCDAFYIGGTKNGALFGEALVINEPAIDDHFRWMIKRQGGMLAKGRLIGVQFEALFNNGENSLYFDIARHENEMAQRLRDGLNSLGIDLLTYSPTNQVFPVIESEIVKELEKQFFFYEWAEEKDGMIPIRLVTSWGTMEDEVDLFIETLKENMYK